MSKELEATDDLTEVLNFDNPISGFYHEGLLGPSPPIPMDVIYISGRKERCTNLDFGHPADGLFAERYTSRRPFTISFDEAKDFYRLTEEKLYMMFNFVDIPDEFVKWFMS